MLEKACSHILLMGFWRPHFWLYIICWHCHFLATPLDRSLRLTSLGFHLCPSRVGRMTSTAQTCDERQVSFMFMKKALCELERVVHMW
jgi:hypothetical protein